MRNIASRPMPLTRRAILGSATAMIATPALAQECRLGPPKHHKGPTVFMGYDQVELDAAYDQNYYEPLACRPMRASPPTARLYVPASVRHGGLPTDRRRSKSSTSIEPTARRHR